MVTTRNRNVLALMMLAKLVYLIEQNKHRASSLACFSLLELHYKELTPTDELLVIEDDTYLPLAVRMLAEFERLREQAQVGLSRSNAFEMLRATHLSISPIFSRGLK